MKRKKFQCPFCLREYSASLDPYGWWILRKHQAKWATVEGKLLIYDKPQMCEGSNMGFNGKARWYKHGFSWE